MKETLRAGLEGVYRYRVPESKTVPRIYGEAHDVGARFEQIIARDNGDLLVLDVLFDEVQQ